ncbi:Phosphate-selective porin O and P [Poriferisphaera corsica]|uniref:Phosphate-selective porin O and P n=1 Tax=Poriferisphaera corsica TaxID=2528020 RepID=A0A517YQK7_9BACT|nr:porin [Poriferisphaera corsica]QDU32500.1 Phosphate-selective porin O and P [Poriferisphaera corsica]
MSRLFNRLAASAAIALSVGSFVQAEGQVEVMSGQIQQFEKRIAELERQQISDELTSRQTQQVKDLIADVLADAETRSSLLQSSVLAGNENGKFFIRSADNDFYMNIGAHLQIRYYYNVMNNRPKSKGGDKISEFQVRRARLIFKGHVVDPRFQYRLDVGTNPYNGSSVMELAFFKVQVTDDFAVLGGQWQLPYLREELTSLARQLTVARASAAEYFTLDAGTGLQFYYNINDNAKFTGAISNGEYAAYPNDYNGFGENVFDYALTSRLDMKLAGDWRQIYDRVSWSGTGMSAFLGAAVHYEKGFENDAIIDEDLDYLAWSVDAMYKNKGLMLEGSMNGSHVLNADETTFLGDPLADAVGVVLQAGFMATEKVQPFVRYEYFDKDSKGFEANQGVTVGANYFINKHNLKLTSDVVYFFDGTAPGMNPFGNDPMSGALGFSAQPGQDFSQDPMIAWRTEFQIAF